MVLSDTSSGERLEQDRARIRQLKMDISLVSPHLPVVSICSQHQRPKIREDETYNLVPLLIEDRTDTFQVSYLHTKAPSHPRSDPQGISSLVSIRMKVPRSNSSSNSKKLQFCFLMVSLKIQKLVLRTQFYQRNVLSLMSSGSLLQATALQLRYGN